MKNKWMKTATYILKIALTVTILYLIFSRFDLGQVLRLIAGLPLWLILMMIGTTVFKHFTQYKNWKHSLQLNPGYKKIRSEVLSSYLIGIPLRFLIPGGTATYGKMFFVQNTSKLASAMSVTSEKFFMTWMTWTYAAWAAFFYFTEYSLWLRFGFAFLCTLTPFAVYLLLGRFAKTRTIQPLYARKAPQIAAFQAIYVFTTIIQLWLVLNHFSRVTFGAAVIRISLMNFANAIPITISGLGLREYFAIHFFGTAGISAEQAVSATLTLFIFHDLIPALIGSYILLNTKKVQDA
jgi:hypothetical protein